MAGRSQLPVQIMENQTRFDLNAAIENWKKELSAQPNFSADDRRELETHLRDLISEFQRKSLSDEESFRLANKKIGRLRQIGKEFRKNKVFMIKNWPVIFCAGLGLLIGFAMFLIGLLLASYQTVSDLVPSFLVLHAPAFVLLAQLRGEPYDWSSNAGLLQLLAAFLIYWTMLGVLVGLGLRVLFKLLQNRNTSKLA
jgi:hypothetical protein